jgi:hypothetical protein
MNAEAPVSKPRVARSHTSEALDADVTARGPFNSYALSR